MPCPHGKPRSTCKPCGGSGFCEHLRRKDQCTTCCKGKGICSHGRRADQCKDCGTRGYCKHGKQKALCKECGGSQLCKTPLCETHKNKKYDGYCLRCCMFMRPDIKVSRNYKTKELSVVEDLLEEFDDLAWITDKRIPDGCSAKRPDAMTDTGTQHIIVEIDETQHKSYDCSCNNKRLMELSQDVNHEPIVFIRFNPDGYIKKDSIRVKSCWKTGDDGILRIENLEEWDTRIQCLFEQVRYWLDNDTDKTVEVVHLFYDEI